MMKTVYLGIGTNLGDREENLRTAIKLIGEHIGEVTAKSSVYETEPWGFTSETSFLNMVIKVETKLTPSGLLGRILMIEAMMGRLREGEGYKSRIIDIDILFFEAGSLRIKFLKFPIPEYRNEGLSSFRFLKLPEIWYIRYLKRAFRSC